MTQLPDIKARRGALTLMLGLCMWCFGCSASTLGHIYQSEQARGAKAPALQIVQLIHLTPDEVHSFAAYESEIVVINRRGQLRLVSRKSGKPVWTLADPKHVIRCAARVASRNQYVAGTRDGHLLVIDSDNGHIVSATRVHALPIESIAVLATQNRVLTSAGDDGAKLVSLDTLEWKVIAAQSFQIAAASEQEMVCNWNRATLQVFKCPLDAKPLVVLDSTDDASGDVSLSSTGDMVVAGPYQAGGLFSAGRVEAVVRRISDPERVTVLRIPSLNNSVERLVALRLINDNQVVLVTSSRIIVWDCRENSFEYNVQFAGIRLAEILSDGSIVASRSASTLVELKFSNGKEESVNDADACRNP